MWFFRDRKNDARGGRLVFLIECLLNQNARDLGAAESPATTRKVLGLLENHAVGMVQIPCPEIACLGFERRRAPGQSIRQAMEASGPVACCQRLSVETADRIQCYVEQGYQVLAVLGGNEQSPGCAVHAGEDGLEHFAESSGVFLQALASELARRDLRIPFRGMRDADKKLLDEDLDWLRERLSGSGK